MSDWTKRDPAFQAFSDGYLRKIADGKQGAKRAAFAKAEIAARAERAAVAANYPRQVGCGCACVNGGFCGGCGHAGCGRRAA